MEKSLKKGNDILKQNAYLSCMKNCEYKNPPNWFHYILIK